MKYAIVDLLWAKSHGIEILPEMRTSIDQSKVILHEEMLVPFEDESFPRYSFSDPTFIELLNSEEWTSTEEEPGECIKEHTTQDNWKPSMATASLWKVVDEEHKGTIDDPIIYIPPMEIFKDKYYIQNGIKYKCTRNSEQPLTHDLSALVGLYVETI